MKKSLLFAAGFALAAMPLSAQRLAPGYITKPESDQLHTYISAWNGGSGTITMDGTAWEDEEFFTSRVKPKKRFYDVTTQVYPGLTQHTGNTSSTMNGTDKRYLNWIPVGDNGEDGFNAIPNAKFDSETFSMWSYVDHWGNWTSPYGWVPGAFADVAHKNGVAASGVASVPNASMPSNWSPCLEGVIALGADKVGKFLYYHGVDGLGYNSEWSSWSPKSKGLTTLHTGLYSYMSSRNPLFENIWYNGTTQTGSCSFDHQINESNSSELIKGTSMFLNYNWAGAGHTNSINYVKSLGYDPFVRLYAGMNQEGSSGTGNGSNFTTLKSMQLSIGVWGSHMWNMFWNHHGQGGSTGQAMQRYYLDQTEGYYTGISRNPAIKMTLKNTTVPYVFDDWAGMSTMVSARSVLNWDLSTEPFYTFFNMGNGEFFNWKGERLNNIEWYSLGIQDYLPTWRWWFAPTILGGRENTLSASDVKLNAEITWEDAYVGGSCLKVSGTNSGTEYLHLFKSDFATVARDKIVLKYKLLGGKGKVSLIAYGATNATNNSNGTYTERTKEIFNDSQCEAIEDASYGTEEGGWQTLTWDLTAGTRLTNWKVTALKFEGVENLEMLIGGLWVEKNGVTYATPAAPQINSVKVLANTYTGVDAKLIWTMDNNAGKKAGTPVYNSDVKTSMFKVYSQDEGGEENFVCATTSWAAIAFQCPNTDNNKKIRFGVSAVSMDTQSESAITWSAYQTKPSYTASEEVLCSKLMIKPQEGFSCYYADPLHASSTWKLVNQAGATVASGSGVRLDVPNGLDQGGYDLILNEGTSSERKFGFFVQVSSEGVGALPQVYTLSHEGNTVDENSSAIEIELTDTPTLAYTGRKADGSSSRAVMLNNHWIGAQLSDLGIGDKQSVSFGGWFKFNAIPDGEWNFLYITNKNDTWPKDEWGWSWCHGYADGHIELVFRGNSDGASPGEMHYLFPNFKVQAGVWTHLMMVCEEASGDRFRALLYVNGVLQESTWEQRSYGSSGTRYTGKTTLDYTTGMSYTRSEQSYLLFGGTPYTGVAIDGICDDFQVWNVACTQEQVKQSMNGFNSSNYPSGMVACWNFETDANSDHYFTAFGSKSGAKLSTHEWVSAGANTKAIETKEPAYTPGCPFLEGSAYPVVTSAEWKDQADRRTQFTTVASRASTTAGEAGSATVKFNKAGDHTVTLTLKNNYGEDSKDFPVFIVKDETQGIEDITTDGNDMTAYTVDNVLFLEFAQDGAYDVEVYNVAGMLVGARKIDAVAGQNARITLGASGVYMVKASVNGKALRTLKVLSK